MEKNNYKTPDIKENVKEEPKEPKAAVSQNKIARSFFDVIKGSFLIKEKALQQLPFFFFLTGLALFYIANTYYAEKTIRQINKINKELKELKSEYIISKSDVMYLSNQSQIAKATAQYGIKEAIVPPKKIVIEPKQNDKEKVNTAYNAPLASN